MDTRFLFLLSFGELQAPICISQAQPNLGSTGPEPLVGAAQNPLSWGLGSAPGRRYFTAEPGANGRLVYAGAAYTSTFGEGVPTLCGQEDEDGGSRLCWCALRSHPAIFGKVLPPFLALPAR